MLNFREKLNKINEGAIEEYSIEKQTEFFLTGLLSSIALKEESNVKRLVFISNGARICVKVSKKHVTNLFDLPIIDRYCREVFDSIKAQLRSENLRIEEYGEEGAIFTVYFD